ncbi:unnamed protein product [Amoebophrya sp. A120]|nr:unnamed protein product [Amoebophrya sp. A120]|eukprot:GSA120T00000306001.1
MPRAGNKRKKTRTHKVAAAGEEETRKTPKCFVVKKGKVDKTLQELVQDFRHVCAPNSALKLKESRMNKMRDFVNVASHFHVTHVNQFSQNTDYCYFKIGKLPQGPTLTFVLKEFTTCKDVKSFQKKPRDASKDYLQPPLLLLNGMRLQDVVPEDIAAQEEAGVDAAGNKNSSCATSSGTTTSTTRPTSTTSASSNSTTSAASLHLVATALKNMFPAVDVNTFSTKRCRRVALFNYDQKKQLLYFRHYGIVENHAADVSRTVQKLMKPTFVNRKKDVCNYLLNQGAGGCDSDSEGGESMLLEETAPGWTTRRKQGDAENYGAEDAARRKKNSVAVKLVEIGPRMTLKLLKGETGFYEGSILFQEFLQKTAREQAQVAKRMLDAEKQKTLKQEKLEADQQHREQLRAKREQFEQRKQDRVVKRIGGEEEDEEDDDVDMIEGADVDGTRATSSASTTNGSKNTTSRAKFNPFSWSRKNKKEGSSTASTAGNPGTVEINSATTSKANKGGKGNQTMKQHPKMDKKKLSVLDKWKKSSSGTTQKNNAASGNKMNQKSRTTSKPMQKHENKKSTRKGRGREKAKAVAGDAASGAGGE